ncbi:MAG: HAD family hydrolase [Elainellaceae cyanobacterium]
MTQTSPTVLALDFDGVICDGLIEYFQTAWQAYCQIYSPSNSSPPSGLAEQFYKLRPVIETGWEMPMLLRSLVTGVSEVEILDHWGAIAQQQAQQTKLSPTEIAAKVDQVRDNWISTDLAGWLAQHRFYSGVQEWLRQVLASSVYLVIITTKEGRFVQRLLQQQQVDLPVEQIFGKEVQQPKAQTLRALRQQLKPKSDHPLHIWFVEDRLKTLQSIQKQSDLSDIKLFLADWGYNLPSDREIARQDENIHLLSIETLSQSFSEWCNFNT